MKSGGTEKQTLVADLNPNKSIITSNINGFSSVAQSCPTPCDPTNCSMPVLPVYRQLSELNQTHVHRVCDATQPSHPLPSLSPPAFNLPQHRGLFKWVRLCIRWPKYWSFSFSISPSMEYSGPISFRIDWFDLLAVQGTLKESSPTPHIKSISSLVLSYLYDALSHPYMTTGKP